MTAEELRQAIVDGVDGAFGPILGRLDTIRAAIRPSGRPFSLPMQAQTDGTGLATVQWDGPRIGQVWYLDAIAVSVGGASSAALLTVYLDSNDEANLIDHLGGLSGNAPSRGTLYLTRPIPLWGGWPVLAVIRGAAAAQPVFARMYGRAEEVLEVNKPSGVQYV